MTVTNRPTGSEKKLFNSQFFLDCLTAKGDGGSSSQKRRAAPLPDTVCVRKNSYTPVASDTTTEKGAGGPIRGFLVFALFLSGIWFKGKKSMLCSQSRALSRHTLTRCGMHFRSTQMGQYNGFRRRLGILPVNPTHQTDGSVPRWCSTCCVHGAKMRIWRRDRLSLLFSWKTS